MFAASHLSTLQPGAAGWANGSHILNAGAGAYVEVSDGAKSYKVGCRAA